MSKAAMERKLSLVSDWYHALHDELDWAGKTAFKP